MGSEKKILKPFEKKNCYHLCNILIQEKQVRQTAVVEKFELCDIRLQGHKFHLGRVGRGIIAYMPLSLAANPILLVVLQQ